MVGKLKLGSTFGRNTEIVREFRPPCCRAVCRSYIQNRIANNKLESTVTSSAAPINSLIPFLICHHVAIELDVIKVCLTELITTYI